MNEFSSEVYDLWVRYASKAFRCAEEQVTIAIAIAWYLFTKHGAKYGAVAYIRFAVRHVREGRDVPGVQPFNQGDALDHAWETEAGMGMGMVKDHRPGPDRIASDREEVEALYAIANAKEKALLDMLLNGYEQKEIAEAMGCWTKEITRMKRRLAARRLK